MNLRELSKAAVSELVSCGSEKDCAACDEDNLKTIEAFASKIKNETLEDVALRFEFSPTLTETSFSDSQIAKLLRSLKDDG